MIYSHIMIILFIVALLAGEIYLSIKIGAAIGALRTIFIMLLVTLAGLFMAKLEGFAIARRFDDEIKSNKSMTDTAVELVFVVTGALLLILPGFLTDVVAFLFILPPTRRYFASRVNPSFRKKIETLVEKKRREFLSRKKSSN